MQTALLCIATYLIFSLGLFVSTMGRATPGDWTYQHSKLYVLRKCLMWPVWLR